MAAHTSEQLQAAMLWAVPPGWAVNKEPAGYFGRLFLGLSDEVARLERRVDDLMNELDPRSAQEMLPEWYRSVGLPDPCVGPPPTAAVGRLQLLSRLNPALRGQSIPVLIAFAASLGFTVTIALPEPWSCDSSCDAAIMDWTWAFTWIVQAAAVPVYVITCDSSCDDPLAWWGTRILECEFRRRAPPYSTVLFQYGAP